jgi:hypothetical protein
MGYNIRILNDVVYKMTTAQLLLILHLIGVFEGSNLVTLGDAFKKAVVYDKNVQIYISALIELGAGENFAEFLDRSFMSFNGELLIEISIQRLMFQKPDLRRRNCSCYVFVRSLPDNLGSNLYPEILVDFFMRILRDGIWNGRIPVGAKLMDCEGRVCLYHFSSHNGSLWTNICPKCRLHVDNSDKSIGDPKYCQNDGHMHQQMGDYPHLGRYMFKRIFDGISNHYFWMFCTQYAKFCASLMLNPNALSQVSFHSRNFDLMLTLPFLPIWHKTDKHEAYRMREILKMLQEKHVGNQPVLFPKTCMLLLEPSLKMEFLTKGAIVQKLAASLTENKFKEVIMRRVLNAPDKKKLCFFKKQNTSFCKEILKFLRMHEAPEGLVRIFEALCEIKH